MEGHFLKSHDKLTGWRGVENLFTVKSPEMLIYVGSKFYQAQQYPGIPINICRPCFF